MKEISCPIIFVASMFYEILKWQLRCLDEENRLSVWNKLITQQRTTMAGNRNDPRCSASGRSLKRIQHPFNFVES